MDRIGHQLTLPLGGLYVIYNSINHKFYVGSTVNFDKRWILHKHLLRAGKHHSPYLQNAWNKYGESSFRFVRIQLARDRVERLQLEQHYLDTLKPAYNVSQVATSVEGIVRSEETREKMRLAQRDPKRLEALRIRARRPKSEEHRRKIGDANRGRRHTEESRAKMREASKRRWKRPEEREKLSRARRTLAANRGTD